MSKSRRKPVAPLYGPPAPNYDAVHYWLRISRGSARLWPCLDCHAPARQWAYDNSDPRELIEEVHGSMLRFSGAPWHYIPLCRRCHAVEDRTARGLETRPLLTGVMS